MSDLKRLENQLEQLERSYKLGIISEDEYKRGKNNLEKKIKPLKDEQKKTEESKKIIDEVLSSEKKHTEKGSKKTPKEAAKKKKPEPKKSEPKTTEPKKTKKKEKAEPKATKPAKEKKEKTDFNGSIWAGLVIILLVVVVFFLFGSPQQAPVDKTVGEKNLTGVNETVNVFFYSSYSCQYCKQTNEVMQNIDEAYGDNVNVVRNHYPYNIEIDLQMDIAAECAKRQGIYDNYSLMLYEADKPVSEDELVLMAQELGLNSTGFETCLKNQETAEDVLKEYQGAIQMGIDKIPAVNIDGATIVGVKPAVIYETIIDDELNID